MEPEAGARSAQRFKDRDEAASGPEHLTGPNEMKRRTILLLSFAAILVGAVFVVIPHLLPWALSFHRPDIRFTGAKDQKVLFITIDDAPSKNTTEILRVLRKYDVPATFFVIADRVKSPSQLEEIVAAKHSLGNHLKTTKACSKLSLQEFQADLDACSELLKRAGEPKLFRPASDFGTKAQIAYAKTRGYEAVMGTVFPLDHWISDPAWIQCLVRWLTIPGGIVILHDGDVRGHTTAQVLDRVLPALKGDGYVFRRLEATQSRRW